MQTVGAAGFLARGIAARHSASYGCLQWCGQESPHLLQFAAAACIIPQFYIKQKTQGLPCIACCNTGKVPALFLFMICHTVYFDSPYFSRPALRKSIYSEMFSSYERLPVSGMPSLSRRMYIGWVLEPNLWRWR